MKKVATCDVQNRVLAQRRAGVLLHPTSLPGQFKTGDIGPEAYRFIEFLAAAGISVWQVLPLGPTHADGSPYQCFSTFACNTNLISIDWLQTREMVSEQTLADGDRDACLREAHQSFCAKPGKLAEPFERFVNEQRHWLNDYALFLVIRALQKNKPWHKWEEKYRARNKRTMTALINKHADEISYHQFCQFIFEYQWHELKKFAHQHGVYLFGDVPIYVAMDSADVWTHPQSFQLDEKLKPLAVAGVPPDYFSETGQLWGNPLYDWEQMQEGGFQWWKQRIQRQFELYDVVRIDHFRGLESYWSVPYGAKTAIHGEWISAPGDALLNALKGEFGCTPFVAEDLGIITPEVNALRTRHDLPGMKILQFAFDGNTDNAYLPHNHEHNFIVYTGTHDNDTTLGWLGKQSDQEKDFLRNYLRLQEGEDWLWEINATALASVAVMAVLPMQDILDLDGDSRMNTPGTVKKNWSWRFEWEQVPYELAPRLRHLCCLYGRI